MRIALDAMGGDHAPAVTVAGAVAAARNLGLEVLLVGRLAEVEAELAKHHTQGLSLSVVPASQVVEMAEHPAEAVRGKPDASIVVGLKLVQQSRAQAFVSAGNTGAGMAAALLQLKRISGIERPALGVVLPSQRGPVCLIDGGANVDVRPPWLAQFGLMGSIYMERVFGLQRPRVATLSIGEETTKGNQLVLAAQPLLRELPINYVGNVEGKDIPAGLADVVVCDGFVGNVALKLAEGVASMIVSILREEIKAGLLSSLAGLLLRPVFQRVRRRIDYAEYGGAPLLGVNGVCIIAHGRSNARAIESALRVAARAAEQDLVGHISRGLQQTLVRQPVGDGRQVSDEPGE
ncbi:MAG: phosphate acyltransferase PlsX [Chloroflexi bacterium]|nr:phosphate acyltransferase PlsX [Chloroflexota bacterium]